MSLRFKPAIFAGFFLRAEDGYAGRSASKAADFRHLRRKAEKFLFLALFFILPKYRWYVDTTINVVDHLDGHRIKVLNDSIDVRMNGERLEYGELYASEQSNVTFTVQVSNINTFNEINPVVKVLNGAGEENPEAVNFTTVDSDSGKIYTYNVSLKDDEYITIDDTNNICTFALGQSYFGAWYPIKDNYITDRKSVV